MNDQLADILAAPITLSSEDREFAEAILLALENGVESDGIELHINREGSGTLYRLLSKALQDLTRP